MLNRRLLRIKAIKYLYAYHAAQSADLEIAKDGIVAFFTNDVLAEFPKAEEELKQSREQAIAALTRKLDEKRPFSPLLPPDVKTQAEEAETFFQNKRQADRMHLSKLLLSHTEDIYEKYIQLLALLLDLVRHCQQEVKGSQAFWEKNEVVKELETFEPLQKAIIRSKNIFPSSLLKDIFRNNIKQDEYIAQYTHPDTHHSISDIEILTYMVREAIFKNVTFQTQMEEDDLEWGENKKVVKDMVVDTFKHWKTNGQLKLLELTKDWESDKHFMTKLFNETSLAFDEYMDLLSPYLKNWDTDRLAVMDMIILVTAIAEMIHFPAIPVKVSINEYIEISKSFSTPKSKIFINGVLDKLSSQLISQGKIKKSGLGMIDGV